MSLQDNITVNAIYTRSINIERDIRSESVIKGYIPTTRALQVLNRVTETLNQDSIPRSWSLIGPYGSGKSSFGVFLPHLLGNPSSNVCKTALRILDDAAPETADQIRQHTRGTSGYLPVLITGTPEPLSNRLIRALYESGKQFWAARRGRTPAVIKKLKASDTRSVTDVIKLVDELQAALVKANCRGIVFVIDELGKFLEYEARHYGANDIYLLQALAEKAYEEGECNLLLFVMMHQAFEQYAKSLGQGLRDEWAKIQGRFESIPFLEVAEQTLRVAGAAIESDFNEEESQFIETALVAYLGKLEDCESLAGYENYEETTSIFRNCYPLHPITAQILPLLCQKVAQNERTLFSYLGSHEPHGFQESISRLENAGDWIYPWEIFDYFILNQPATVADAITHRRWAEILSALERHAEATETETQLIKTIGLLNIIGQRSGLKASPQLLELLVPRVEGVEHALERLRFKSIIQFRKFSGEYRVWQGSDFDIDDALANELVQIGHYDLVEVLNRRRPINPIVARRATIRGHAIRYFEPLFVDANSFKKTKSLATNPRVILFIAQRREDAELFKTEVVAHFSNQDVLGLVQSGLQLRESVAETLAIERIQATRSELNSDPIAARECKDRFNAAKRAELEILQSVLDKPENNIWVWDNKELGIKNRRALQTELSEVMEKIFSKSPIIRNELINRDAPSSQANAARNKLLKALLEHPGEENLGIDKFPAEKALYFAVLKDLGFHVENKGTWAITSPKISDSNNVGHLWSALDEFLGSTEIAAKPFTDLNKKLMAPPYGIKKGLLPIFYALSYLVNHEELALFEDGIYTPIFTEDVLERFLTRPETFKVQRFRIEGIRASVLSEYAKALYADPEKVKSLLSVAKPLAIFVNQLDIYAKHTKAISPIAVRVRDAILYSKSPQKLIFDELPDLFGIGTSKGPDTKVRDLEGFSGELMKVLRELKYCHSSLIQHQEKLLKLALAIDDELSLDRARKIAISRYKGIESYSLDKDGLSAFIMRLTNDQDGDDLWLEKLLMFLGGRIPSKKWTDQTVAKVEIRLAGYSQRLRELEKLRLHSEEVDTGHDDLNVFLVRAIKKGSYDEEAVAHVTKEQLAELQPAIESINNMIIGISDRNLKLALISALFEATILEENSEIGAKKQSNVSEREVICG